MFVEMTLRDQLICFADFAGMTLLAVSILLPLPNCFLRICLPKLFAAVLKFFLPPTTSSISGSANSNRSAPTCFALGRYIYAKWKGSSPIAVPTTCASAPNPRPRCRPTPL